MVRHVTLFRRFTWVLAVTGIACHTTVEEHTFRVATYNSSLFRDTDGGLVRDLEGGENEQAMKIAEVIQRVRPDVLLVNEFDYDADGRAANLFMEKYLAVGQNGLEPIRYVDYFIGPVNTGRPSGRDLSKNGRLGDPADAIGYGTHEGQYGMLVLSRFPINPRQARTFQKFLWRDMPNALLPTNAESGEPYYDDDDLKVLRLSSKSFWDVPVKIPSADGGEAWQLHLLCSHPTPPVFDGPEDRNGKRNHDEIRLIADYISPERSGYLVDDAGARGGLVEGEAFVILGDLNCDPLDGEGIEGAMNQLIDHPRVDATLIPRSEGGSLTVKKFANQNAGNRGDPAFVTSNFTGGGHGNLRIDYALPSRGLNVVASGVFWPAPGEPGSDAITATDHRCVWIDVATE